MQEVVECFMPINFYKHRITGCTNGVARALGCVYEYCSLTNILRSASALLFACFANDIICAIIARRNLCNEFSSFHIFSQFTFSLNFGESLEVC